LIYKIIIEHQRHIPPHLLMTKTKHPIKQFVKTRLLPGLGCSGAAFQLQETILGIHSRVFFLDIENGTSLVLKIVNTRQRFLNALMCSEYLQGHGINIPEVLFSHEDRRLVKITPMHVICEQRITGETLYESASSHETISEAAIFLSGLHSITRGSWGKISVPSGTSLFDYLKKKAEGKICTWKQADGRFIGPREKEISKWLGSWEKPLEQIALFSLSHCDANPGNIMVGTDRKLYFLDTGHLRFMPPAIDYYTLLVQLCEDDGELIKVFGQAYFKQLTLEEITAFKETEQFFKFYVLLNFCSMLAARIRAGNPSDPFLKQLPGYLRKAEDMISEIID